MSHIRYIIDTSSLIELNQRHPVDVFPSVWRKIEGLINSNRLFAPREVYDEISRIDDLLFDWSKKQPKMFIEPTVEQITIVKEILSRYPSLIRIDRKYDADPWVIAVAIEMIRNPQQALEKIKRIVVTEEKLRGNKIKIPFVCQNYSIEAIDILNMFRMEGWTF